MRPPLTVLSGDGDSSACDWCRYCYEAVYFHAVAESWRHTKTTLARCFPYDSVRTTVAEPASEDYDANWLSS